MTDEDMTPNEIALLRTERANDPSEITFLDHNKTFVTLHPDGSVTYGEGITPTEAAQAFWNAVSAVLNTQPFMQEAVRKAYEEAARVAEKCEPLKPYDIADTEREHIAAAIRALKDKK